MKKGMTFGLAAVAGVFVASSALAGGTVTLFDIDRDGGSSWRAALQNKGKLLKDRYDLTALLGDPGIIGMDGPFGITADKAIDSNLNPFGAGGPAGRGAGGSGLAVVGASAGFGNAGTTVVANYFVDSFDILIGGELQTAAEFDATSLLGSHTVDITVYTTSGGAVTFAGLPAPAAGHSYGVLVNGDFLSRINIYDVAGGAEGITGTGAFYVNIPAPGALALLGVAGLVGRRRRLA